MKFAFFGYREWAYNIAKALLREGYHLDIYTPYKTEFPELKIDKLQINQFDPKEIPELSDYTALLFYGWSWIIPPEIVNKNICVCLHPSPLPRYRGGSPIQCQIIAGEKKSAVTLFKMSSGLDDGPIYYQEPFSLNGDLNEILKRITETGITATKLLLNDFLDGKACPKEQNHLEATTCRRRKPEQSEIKPNEMTAEQIHNLIRCLQEPYPNAYLIASDGKKVFLTQSHTDSQN